jgi:hypothetical protein
MPLSKLRQKSNAFSERLAVRKQTSPFRDKGTGPNLSVSQRSGKTAVAGLHKTRDLASYELRQIKASLEEAWVSYRGIPGGIGERRRPLEPIQAIAAAIKAKDGAPPRPLPYLHRSSKKTPKSAN